MVSDLMQSSRRGPNVRSGGRALQQKPRLAAFSDISSFSLSTATLSTAGRSHNSGLGGGGGAAARSTRTTRSNTDSMSSERHRELMRAFQKQEKEMARGSGDHHSSAMEAYLHKRMRQRKVLKPRTGVHAKQTVEWHGPDRSKPAGPRRGRAGGDGKQAKERAAAAHRAAAARKRQPGALLGQKRSRLPDCAGFRLVHSPRFLQRHEHKHHQASTPRNVTFLLGQIRSHFKQRQLASANGVMGLAQWLRKFTRCNRNAEYGGDERSDDGGGENRNRRVEHEAEEDDRGREIFVSDAERARNRRSVRSRHQGTANTLDFDGFAAAVRALKICFQPAAARALFRYFDQDGSGRISCLELQHGICGALPPSRAPLMGRVFRHLDADGSGSIDMHDLSKQLAVRHHPQVLAGIATEAEVRRGLMRAMDASANGAVSREEWDFFFTEMSAIVPDDGAFTAMVERVFGLRERQRDCGGGGAEPAAKNQREGGARAAAASRGVESARHTTHLQLLQRRDRKRRVEKQSTSVDLQACMEGRYMLDTAGLYKLRKEHKELAEPGADDEEGRLDGHVGFGAARMQLGRAVGHEMFEQRPTTAEAQAHHRSRRRGSAAAMRKSCWGDTVHPAILSNERAWKLRQG
jgi:Ca2+-binding EF-hand superfamily protein